MRIKQSIKRIPILEEYIKKRRITKWIQNGYTPSSHYVKQMAILYYAITYKVKVLVETGTFLGEMIWAQKGFFKKLYSIELSKELYEKAKRRFRNHNHVHLLNGDSSDKIKEVLDQLKEPAIFWLDGHYSEGSSAKGEKSCPIIAELTNIFKSSYTHVILIDDARLFVGEDDYPTLEELETFVKQNSKYGIRIENDIIILSY